MSIQQLKAQARKHWTKWLPEKVRELKAEGKLDEVLTGAAQLAQKEIEFLMKYRHYPEHAANEVALKQFILLPPEGDGVPADQQEELDAMEAEYRKNVAPYL